ncbi:MAG: amidase [Sphingomonadaceae bacterium]
MDTDVYSRLDATSIAGMIRDGEITAVEVWDAALKALDLVNPDLNGVAEGPWEQPLVHSTDGPFAGVPFAIKDVICHAEGVLSRMGSRLLGEGIRYPADTELMDRFRRAGLATICTTTTPEFALNVATESVLDGPTCNPWDVSRSAGGSSGGSAALVSAGALPMAHANDGAGSIRIPAAHNGLIGLKPSRGRLPVGPDCQEIMYGLAQEFAVTKTVRDTAALLDAVAGWAPGEKQWIAPPARPWLEAIEAEPQGLRIAFCTEGWGGIAPAPDVAKAVSDTARRLQERGHFVDQARPAISWEPFVDALVTTWCSGTAALLVPLASEMRLEAGRLPVERTTQACLDHGLTMTPVDLGRAMASYNTLSRSIGSFFEGWDVLLTPVGVAVAPELGFFNADDASISGPDWVKMLVEYYPYLAPFNVSGTPALAVPIGVSSDALPIGVQLTAQMGREDVLLQVARQLEQSDLWNRAVPAYHVSKINPITTAADQLVARP